MTNVHQGKWWISWNSSWDLMEKKNAPFIDDHDDFSGGFMIQRW